MQSVEFYKGIVHLLKNGKRQFEKQEIILRSNYKVLMLSTFFGHKICVSLRLKFMKTNLVAILCERPS